MNRFITVSFLLLSSFLMLGCTQVSQEKSIELGSILILSGEGASWGNAARNGIELAVNEINADGGINGKIVTVNYQDDQGDPQKGLTAFQTLADTQDIRIIIGPSWSRTGLPLVELANQKEVLMISPSLGVKEFNEGSKFLFNTWPHDYILSEKLAEYVYAKGHRKVALIGAQEVWVKDQTNAFKSKFESLGGSIEVLVEPVPSAKEVSTEALKIKDANIDAVVSTTDGVLVGVLVAKRTRELDVNLPFYSITIDADAIVASQGAYEGMEYLTFLTPTTDFSQKYETKYGIPVEIGADSAYDATMMIAQAIKETNSVDPQVLQVYLSDLTVYNGASGELKTDGKRGFTKAFVVKKVQNGQSIVVKE